MEIKDKGVDNVVADHLSRLENNDVTTKENIDEEFTNEHLFIIVERSHIWQISKLQTQSQSKTLGSKRRNFSRMPISSCGMTYFCLISLDWLLRRCVATEEAHSIMCHCHGSSYGEHHSGERVAVKVLQSGFF